MPTQPYAGPGQASGPAIVVPQMPQLTVIKLVNEGPTEFNMAYGPNQRVVLPPGGFLFVHEEVAWHILGRWWMDNSNPRNRARVGEYNRLRVLYGAYEDDGAWERNKPRVKAYTPTGEPIITVVDDPSGIEAQSAQTPLGANAGLAAQVQYLQQQLEAVMAAQDIQARQAAAAGVDPTVDGAQLPPAPVSTSVEVGGVMVPVSPDTLDHGVVIATDGTTESLPSRLPVMSEPVPLDGDIATDEPSMVLVGPSTRTE